MIVTLFDAAFFLLSYLLVMKAQDLPTTETDEKIKKIEMKLEEFHVVKIRFELSFGLGPGGIKEVNTAFDLQLWL